jgi:hypothetical protein
MTGSYVRRDGIRKSNPPVYGICPKCGCAGIHLWVGAGMYRCNTSKCWHISCRDEIKNAPPKAVVKQNLLFEEEPR